MLKTGLRPRASGLGLIAAAILFARTMSGASLTEAPDFNAVKRAIDSSAARIKVVNLWATWCGPCVAEMADLQRIAGRFPRVELIGVSLDDAIPGDRAETKLKVAQFLEKRGVKYRNVYFTGRQNELTDRFHFEGELPVTFVYGPDGKELTRVVGQLNYGSFTKKLAALEKQQKR